MPGITLAQAHPRLYSHFDPAHPADSDETPQSDPDRRALAEGFVPGSYLLLADLLGPDSYLTQADKGHIRALTDRATNTIEVAVDLDQNEIFFRRPYDPRNAEEMREGQPPFTVHFSLNGPTGHNPKGNPPDPNDPRRDERRAHAHALREAIIKITTPYLTPDPAPQRPVQGGGGGGGGGDASPPDARRTRRVNFAAAAADAGDDELAALRADNARLRTEVKNLLAQVKDLLSIVDQKIHLNNNLLTKVSALRANIHSDKTDGDAK